MKTIGNEHKKMKLIINNFGAVDILKELRDVDNEIDGLQHKAEVMILNHISKICKENGYTSLCVGRPPRVVNGIDLRINDHNPDYIKHCDIHKLCSWLYHRFSVDPLYYCELGEFKAEQTAYVDIPIPILK